MSALGLGWAETVTLHPHTGDTTDSSGSTIPVYGADVALDDAIVYPGASSESEVPGDVVIGGLTVQWVGQPLQMPGALDEMTARGLRYRVDADPDLFHNPHAPVETTVVRLLRRV